MHGNIRIASTFKVKDDTYLPRYTNMCGMRSVCGLLGLRSQYSSGMGVRRTFVSADVLRVKQMPPRPPPIDESEFTEVFIHGSGPGGQKIVCQSS